MRRLSAIMSTIFVMHAAAQPPAEKLAAHTEEFRQEIIEVTDGVHVAVGYALANSILIEGDDAVIIVDVTESPAAAEEIKAEFDKITDKPVAAIIYTHNHTDHIMGAKVFAGDDAPEVYAQADLRDNVRHIYEEVTPAIFARSIRQFGVPLAADVFLNCGIGPRLRVGTGGLASYIEPTKTFEDRLETEIAGVRVVLQHAPGETDDQLYVWLPDKKTLLPGDNFYKSFPNLYAIRGTRYRDVREWANSLDKMLAEGDIEHLVPSHTRPISGAAEIKETLSNYRDAIRHVYDATIKGINAGVDPVALSQQVELPEKLADQPYLQEFYGTVPWSVRAIYAGTLGWFDGNATNLFLLPAKEHAEKMATLAGGVDKLRATAEAALDDGDAQWAAQLADHLIALDAADQHAKDLKAAAFEQLAQQQTSANGRNYYLTQAQQLRAE